jgi:hypothetical protein
MRVNCDCTSLINEVVAVEVEATKTVEDVLALLSVQNPKLEFSRMRIMHNGQELPLRRPLKEIGIRDDMTVQVEAIERRSCCMIF